MVAHSDRAKMRLQKKKGSSSDGSDPEVLPHMDTDDELEREKAQEPRRPAFVRGQQASTQEKPLVNYYSDGDNSMGESDTDSDLGHGPLETWFERLARRHYSRALPEVRHRQVDVELANASASGSLAPETSQDEPEAPGIRFKHYRRGGTAAGAASSAASSSRRSGARAGSSAEEGAASDAASANSAAATAGSSSSGNSSGEEGTTGTTTFR